MEDIKFRAWHEGNNDFVYTDIKEIWKNGFLVSESDEDRCPEKIEKKSIYATDKYLDKHDAFTPNANWEQYTGLKDKFRNDKEVYEGDIYKWVGVTFPITIDSFHGNRFMFGKDILCRAYIEEGHFLGNIHQNSELLGSNQ